MVWIYGGGYRFGVSSQVVYDGTALARQNVVVVTFNHRVGVEGYAYLPGVPANRGLLDQVAALRWVQENIAAFGGDPDQVTVFGESSGAGAIASLLVMPLAAGLFRRAIAQSVPGTFFSPELAADVTAAIAAEAGLPPTTEAFAAADPAWLTAASDAVNPADHQDRWGPAGRTGVSFSPVVDGEVLPAAPWQALAAGAGRGTGSAGRSPRRWSATRCAGSLAAERARPPTARPIRMRTQRCCSSWSTPTGCSGCRRCT
jgi:para-nitrobenzyl esterase